MPQLSDLKIDLEQGVFAQFGKGANVLPSSFFGQFIGLTAERLSLVWQAMQDVYLSQNPNTAFGASLDNVGALRGIPRLVATKSFINNVKLFGVVGTPIQAGVQFFPTGSPLSVFQTTGPITLAAGQDCIQTISFSSVAVSGNWELAINGSATVALPFNATAAQVQTAVQGLNFCAGCTVTGNMTAGFTITFSGTDGDGGLMDQPQFLVVVDSLLNGLSQPVTVTPAITQAGIPQANVTVTAIATGPHIANVATLINILTPISGLTGAFNVDDAHVGTNVETDNAYRARMAKELQVAGAGTVPAIRSRLLAVKDVTSVYVYENIMDVPDGNGRYPHSVEAVVTGGTDSDIAEELWQVKPAGIATFGNTSHVIIDSQGNPQTMRYSRPVPIPIYTILNLEVSDKYPVGGNASVIAAINDYLNTLEQGESVIVNPQLIAQLAPIPGIDDSEILVGILPGPTLSDNIIIAQYQKAFSQTDFISVTTTPG